MPEFRITPPFNNLVRTVLYGYPLHNNNNCLKFYELIKKIN